jgi:hypothetical protein
MAWFMHKFKDSLDFYGRVLMMPLRYAVNEHPNQNQLWCDCSVGSTSQVLGANDLKWEYLQGEAFFVRPCFLNERSGVVA